jgi:hypothetical protein
MHPTMIAMQRKHQSRLHSHCHLHTALLRYINWQGNSRDGADAINQAFGPNEEDIKQKSLKVIRFLDRLIPPWMRFALISIIVLPLCKGGTC